jgi:hypothetical protein
MAMSYKLNQVVLLLMLGFIWSPVVSQDKANPYIPNSKIQYSFLFSTGWVQKTNFTAISGPEVFQPRTNYTMNGQFLLEWNFSHRLRASTGLMWRSYSFGNFGGMYKKKDFPMMNEDYEDDFYLNRFNIWYDEHHMGIPFVFSYQLNKINKKHELWAEFGGNLYLEAHMQGSISSGVVTDSTDITLYHMTYDKGQQSAVKKQFYVGLQYRYRLNNHHMLIFGLNATWQKDKNISGSYQLVPEYPTYDYHGTYDYSLNTLNLSLGYSINPLRITQKKMEYKMEERSSKIYVPDSMPNKSELRYGIQYLSLVYLNAYQANGEIRLDRNPRNNFYFGFELSYVKYKKNNLAFTIGIKPTIAAYNFEIDLNGYPDISSNLQFSHPVQFFSPTLSTPIGIQYNQRIFPNLILEYEAHIGPALDISGNSSSSWTYYYTDSLNQRKPYLFMDLFRNSILVPELGFKFSVNAENKKENKISVGFGIQYYPIASYISTYQIKQSDGSFEAGEIKMKPLQGYLFFRFALTGKKRRYLKSRR